MGLDSHRHERQTQFQRRLQRLVRWRWRLIETFQQLLALEFSPPVAKLDEGIVVLGFSDQQCNRGSDLNSLRVEIGGKHAGIGQAFGRELAGFVLVAVQAIDPDPVELLQVPFPHSGERQAVQPGIIRDEANRPAPAVLDDVPLRHPVKPHVQIVQTLTLRRRRATGLAVGAGQLLLLVHRHPGETVVGRIAENHQNPPLLLHHPRRAVLGHQFREIERQLRHALFAVLVRRLPAGQRVGQIHAQPFRLAGGRVQLQRRAPLVQQQAELQMRHHIRRRQQLEAEYPVQRRLFQLGAGQAAQTLLVQSRLDVAQHFGQIRAGAATGIENEDLRIGQPVGDVEFLAQHRIHPRHHVAHDFRWRVPHPQLLAQFRVEGLQERLVEILHRAGGGELAEERRSIHPVQHAVDPVQHLGQAQRQQPRRLRQLLEQGADHRHPQRPARQLPVEALAHFAPHPQPLSRWERGARSNLLVPQHPGRKHPVEQGLNQRGAKEMLAILGLEMQAQRVFQRPAQRRQRRQIRLLFQPRPRVAGIRRQKPGHVAGIVQRRGAQQHPLEVFHQTLAARLGERARLDQPGPKILGRIRQPQRLQHGRLTGAILTDQQEIPIIRYQHQPVFFPILADLRAIDRQPAILGHALDFDHAAFRRLAWQRVGRALGKLAGGEQTGIRTAGSGIAQLRHRQHARLQGFAHCVQQVDQRGIIGRFPHTAARGANFGQGGEIGFGGGFHESRRGMG